VSRLLLMPRPRSWLSCVLRPRWPDDLSRNGTLNLTDKGSSFHRRNVTVLDHEVSDQWLVALGDGFCYRRFVKHVDVQLFALHHVYCCLVLQASPAVLT
jgi:hypothetical protein